MRQLTKAAVFVDAENHADLDTAALLRRLGKFDVVQRHAYADWRNQGLDHLAERLEHTSFEMHHTWSGRRRGARKDRADGQMEHDILKVVSRHPEIETVVIVSGDAFFTRVVRQIRRQGRQAIVAADPLRSSKRLCRAADGYIPLGDGALRTRKLAHLERMNAY